MKRWVAIGVSLISVPVLFCFYNLSNVMGIDYALAFFLLILLLLCLVVLLVRKQQNQKYNDKQRSKVVAAILAFFGCFGADRFYLGYPIQGACKVLLAIGSIITPILASPKSAEMFIPLGVFGLWNLIDFIRILTDTLLPRNGKPYAVAGASAPTPKSRYDDLATISRLHDQGALTDEEFEAEKKKLLEK